MATTKVNSEFIAVNAISGTIISDGAITSTHLAVNSVDSSESKSIVKSQEIDGKIIVELVKGTRLVAQDGKASDPKVYITIEGCDGDMESKIIKNNLNPVWGQRFEKDIKIARDKTKPMRFHVIDNDFLLNYLQNLFRSLIAAPSIFE